MNYLGIDVSKAKLDCALLREASSGKRLDKSFSNDASGVKALLAWLQSKLNDAALAKAAEGTASVHVVMEPTGVYHERAALWLVEAGLCVSLVNPARLRSYAVAIGVVSKNDRLDSAVLARYGVAEQPEPWQPPTLAAQTLNALLARREALCQDITREQNRREKTLFALNTPVTVAHSIAQTLEFLARQLSALEAEIDQHIDRDPTLKHNDQLLRSIKGVGPRVAQRMNALMSSHRFKSAEALAAYIGLAPCERQSGSSVRGKTRLSKQGSAHLRQLLFMPAVVAKTHNPHVRAIYTRLIARGKPKMSALGAAMRKLVHLCFGVLHSGKPYSVDWERA